MKEAMLRIEEVEQKREEENQKKEYRHQKRKKEKSNITHTKGSGGKSQKEKDDFDDVEHKHFLMSVHAPTYFEAGELISSMAFGLHEFAQNVDMVCTLSFSHPNTPKQGC